MPVPSKRVSAAGETCRPQASERGTLPRGRRGVKPNVRRAALLILFVCKLGCRQAVRSNAVSCASAKTKRARSMFRLPGTPSQAEVAAESLRRAILVGKRPASAEEPGKGRVLRDGTCTELESARDTGCDSPPSLPSPQEGARKLRPGRIGQHGEGGFFCSRPHQIAAQRHGFEHIFLIASHCALFSLSALNR